MKSQSPASSPGEPTKFGTGRGDRFQTKTGNPLRRRCAATARPMIPSPITPMFLCVGWDVDARRSIEAKIYDKIAGKNGRAQCRNWTIPNRQGPVFILARIQRGNRGQQTRRSEDSAR